MIKYSDCRQCRILFFFSFKIKLHIFGFSYSMIIDSNWIKIQKNTLVCGLWLFYVDFLHTDGNVISKYNQNQILVYKKDECLYVPTYFWHEHTV